MKHQSVILLSVAGMFLAFLSNADAAVVSVKDTKHNLSSAGTNTIRSATSGGTTEICVFCHTPHSSTADAPLWNRTLSVQSYLTYTSDVLGGLGYYAAEDPSNPSAAGYVAHVKTRLCLSCHDGTIALGHLVNLPYDASTGNKLTSDVKMVNANADGTMPSSAAGYIGINLQDDHPVAIPHDSAKDQELRGTILGGAIFLYRVVSGGVQKTNIAGSGNYVECTSCHNAHDNEYGYFLVQSNNGSLLCINCHDKKTGSGTSAHDAATGVSYDPDGTGSLGTTVGGVKCMNCHYSHKSGVDPNNATTPNPSFGKYLLSFQEEGTCFNNTNRWNRPVSVCHGNTSSTKNIQSQETKQYAHKYSSGAGKHQATESKSYGWLGAGNANWHVQCNDCHNSHTAGSVKHTAPGNVIGNSSPLYGAGGVSVSWSGSWPSTPGPAGFSPFESFGLTVNFSTSGNYEYQICLKCHSSFAWGVGTAPLSPSLGVGQLMTDQAKEFNPGNTYPANSMHPVAGPTTNTWGALLAPWTATKGTQTMYCSDCHGTNDGAAPQGPHGSTIPFLLKSAFTDTYSTVKSATQPANDLCFSCHDIFTYQSGADNFNIGGTGFSGGATTNLHTRHRSQASGFAQSTFGYFCVNCHARVPHGYSRKAMIVQRGEGAPYEAGGANAGKITSVNLAGSGAYQVGASNKDISCQTVNGCHQ